MNNTKIILSIVIPCCNEVEVIPETAKRLKAKCDELISNNVIDINSKVVFVDDGSTDDTWAIIETFCDLDKLFAGIKLSRNEGHQNALIAGLNTMKDFSDAIITMDADLQDDINIIDEMIAKFVAGNDIVYGVRNNRTKDSTFKRYTAEKFYKILSGLGGEVIYNHADFRLMSKRAIICLVEYNEVNLFLRGIVPMIGYPSTSVFYERADRFAGDSKYPIKKMISFALDGVTSLSVKPIQFVTIVGFTVFTISIIMLIYIFLRYFMGATISGWSSVIVSVWAIGGLLLLSIGIVGEYIGKIYLETKRRPRYFVEKNITNTDVDI